MANIAQIWYADKLAGLLSETDEGYNFAYDEAYLKSDYAKPISVTLPLKLTAFTSKTLFAFFDGLIPEGWLLDMATEQWKLRPDDRFQLLLAACRDTIGAVTVIPVENA